MSSRPAQLKTGDEPIVMIGRMLRAFRWAAKCALLFVAIMNVSPSVHAASPENSHKFDISVLPALGRYVDLLETPPYLLLALENSGIEMSRTGKIFIPDENAARIKNLKIEMVVVEPMLRFSHRNGASFFYQAEVNGIAIPVTVDASLLGKGTLTIVFPESPANFVIGHFFGAIKNKVQDLASAHLQERLLGYLNGVAQERPHGRSEKEWMASQLLIHGYNGRGFAETGIMKNNSPEWWLFVLPGWAIIMVIAALVYGRFLKRGRWSGWGLK